MIELQKKKDFQTERNTLNTILVGVVNVVTRTMSSAL